MQRKKKITKKSRGVLRASHRNGRVHRSAILVAAAAIIIVAILSVATTSFAQSNSGVRRYIPIPDVGKIANEAVEAVNNCAGGWRQFVSAGVGYTDFAEYWKDFLRWPAHAADIERVQNQLNKARYDVMAAFFRCDTERLQSVTDAYYKLESELYFLRNFVETDGGYLSILPETSGRQQFKDKMVSKMLLRKGGGTDQDTILFEAYYNEFENKYLERAKQYGTSDGDAAYEELIGKIEKLGETLDQFKKFGSELGSLGEDVAEGAIEAGKFVSTHTPGEVLSKVGKGIANRFDACATLSGEAYQERGCASGAIGALFEEQGVDPFEERTASATSEPQSFTQIHARVQQREKQLEQNMSFERMRARYELLYGTVTGAGLEAVLSRTDDLTNIIEGFRLSKDKKNVPLNTLQLLEVVADCAANAHKLQCSD